MPTALEGKLPTDYSNNYFPKAGRTPENTTSADNSISAKEQMLNNYLHRQEQPHFPECLYKSSQGPGLCDNIRARQKITERKKKSFCLRNCRERERNGSFPLLMKDLKKIKIKLKILSPLTLLSPGQATCRFVLPQRGAHLSVVKQTTTPCCTCQARLSTRCFNESLYFLLFSLHHITDRLCWRKS